MTLPELDNEGTGQPVPQVRPVTYHKPAANAHERHERIRALRNLAEQTFLVLGEELYYFEAERQYTLLGYDTFEEYLASPEIDLSRSLAFRLKGIYETFVLRLKVHPDRLLEAGSTKLDKIRPVVDADNLDDWLARAVTLSRSDLDRELDGKAPPPDYPPDTMPCPACRGRGWVRTEE